MSLLRRFARRAAPEAPPAPTPDPASAARAASTLAQIGIDKRRADYIRFHAEMAQRLGLPIPEFGAKS